MCKELHEHVKHCPECQQYIDSVKMTVKICQDVHPPEPVPETVKQELLKKIKSPK